MSEKQNENLPSEDVIIPEILDDIEQSLNSDGDFEIFEPRGLKEFKQYLKDRNEEDVTTEFDILLDDINSVHAERLNRILGNATDSEFVKIYMKLLEYVKPKVKGMDAPLQIPKEATTINIQIVNNRNGNKEN